ncbi:hypothetical protein PRZ48_014955 [Zasmidium cellare]|uniref:Uncharacterized protein n=1 Tax=Zasmidium cellare TaxID=395010 RepID=A0ABR0DX86_ZASCE|nr:hypothetical protein PRZ48_014955 [Zasmidium cellare]
MHVSTSFAKMATIILPLLTATLVKADDIGPYCGSSNDPMPNIDRCHDAINKIPDGQTTNQEYDAGDCAVKITLGDVVSPPSTDGAGARDAGNQILDTCGPNGWKYVGDVNVSISQCVVCMYGTCTVCDAPTTRRRSVDLLPRNGAPGVECQSGAGTSAQDCRDTYAAMSGKQLSLPFQTTSGACTVVLEPLGQNIVINGDDPVGRIESDLNICGPGGMGTEPGVGKVVDNNPDNYDLIFGKLCGEYGQGYDGCTA